MSKLLIWHTILAYLISLACGTPTLESLFRREKDGSIRSSIGLPTIRPAQEIQGDKETPWKAPDGMPGGDEWYRPSPGFEQKKPGEILKWRDVPNGLSVDNKKTLKLEGAWQIQYRTTNSVGEPDATVVTVLAPKNAKKDSLFVYHWFSVSCSVI
jgi:hypothetical protein